MPRRKPTSPIIKFYGANSLVTSGVHLDIKIGPVQIINSNLNSLNRTRGPFKCRPDADISVDVAIPTKIDRERRPSRIWKDNKICLYGFS